ncbi:unnamed protein product, partial [Microthlaspi erraticum]
MAKANKSLLSSVFKSRLINSGESSIAVDIAGTSQAVKELLRSENSSPGTAQDLEKVPLSDQVSNLLNATAEKSSSEKKNILKVPIFTSDICLRPKELSH